MKVQGFRDLDTTVRLQTRIDLLVSAKINGDAPPRELTGWLNNLDEKRAARLVMLGLLPRRRFDQSKAIATHIADFETSVKTRKTNGPDHAERQRRLVERVCAGTKVEVYDDIDPGHIMRWLKDRNLSDTSRRHYLIALKAFTAWMLRDKRVSDDTMADVELPNPSEDYDRRPLTHDEFRLLMDYLLTFERYPQQKASWTASERRLIYWTAAFTGLRRTELKTRYPHHFHLDGKQPWVEIKGADSKNKEWGGIPIPHDLAAALKEHIKGKLPTTPVFWFPSHCVVDMLKRDLKGAGVELDKGDGKVVDFHSFRATAITWWLLAGLEVLEVQRVARLKSPAMVQKYSRNFRLERTDWLNKMPNFEAPAKDQAAG